MVKREGLLMFVSKARFMMCPKANYGKRDLI